MRCEAVSRLLDLPCLEEAGHDGDHRAREGLVGINWTDAVMAPSSGWQGSHPALELPREADHDPFDDLYDGGLGSGRWMEN